MEKFSILIIINISLVCKFECKWRIYHVIIIKIAVLYSNLEGILGSLIEVTFSGVTLFPEICHAFSMASLK